MSGAMASDDTMCADTMIAMAEKVAGLRDWGGDAFRKPFATLVESAERESELSALGRERFSSWLMLRLVQRLKMVEDRKRRPEIAAQLIDKPVFLFGFPRAGTTFLHTLLSIDPDNVAPAYWQLNLPSPPANDRAINHAASIRSMEENLAFQGWTRPEIAAMHYHAAELPEEDFLAFEYSFISTGFMGFVNVPAYVQEVIAGDFSEAYRWHNMVLQALQIGAQGRRWMLKAPEHSLHIDTLVSQYPDALLVQHHRDPSKVMASVFSVLSAYRANYCSGRLSFGEHEARSFMHMYAAGVAHALKSREDPAMERKFLDVHYLDLARDPLGCLERVYAHAGIPFTKDVEQRAAAWVAANRQGKHGKHRYLLSDYGLTQSEVHQAFGDYIERFDVELETGA